MGVAGETGGNGWRHVRTDFGGRVVGLDLVSMGACEEEVRSERTLRGVGVLDLLGLGGVLLGRPGLYFLGHGGSECDGGDGEKEKKREYEFLGGP